MCCSPWGRKELDTTERLKWLKCPTGSRRQRRRLSQSAKSLLSHGQLSEAPRLPQGESQQAPSSSGSGEAPMARDSLQRPPGGQGRCPPTSTPGTQF